MRLLWLPDVLRAAGLTVHEVDGWAKRGKDSFGPVRGITIHETRGSRTSTDAGEIRVLIEGSTSAPPPIAQLYLSRSGAWHVVASGTCNHNKTGYAGPNKGYGNDSLLGIEAQHAAGEPWTDVQYRSYVRGVAALVDRLDVPVSRVAGHKEHQPGQKTDPGFDMGQFRRDVAAVLAGEDDDMTRDEAIAAARIAVHGLLKEAAAAAGMDPAEAGEPTATGRQVRRYLTAILTPTVAAESTSPEELRAALTALDLDPASIAAAIPTDLAARVVDELAVRLSQGQARE